MDKMRRHDQVRSRNEKFTRRTATKIWEEKASEDNPYIPYAVNCHGYDLLDLVKKKSFVDVFYLLFRGELPTGDESELLEALMIGLINPGPRHTATRAAMNAGVGKTQPVHILPIGLSVLGGSHHGASVIDDSMRFLRKSKKLNARIYAEKMLENLDIDMNAKSRDESEFFNAESPGFGRYYGGVDIVSKNLVDLLLTLPGSGDALTWGAEVHTVTEEHGIGLLSTGIAAAVFADLGFQPRIGGSLFQLLRAPGIAAHGVEMANKHFTAMPFVGDEDYIVEKNE